MIAAPRGEPAYAKYAWLAMVAGGVIGVLIYASEIVPLPSLVAEQERLVEGVWIGISLILIGATGFREGQRWAFIYTLAFIVWALIYEVYRGQEWFLVFAVIAVLLGFRKFFPKT